MLYEQLQPFYHFMKGDSSELPTISAEFASDSIVGMAYSVSCIFVMAFNAEIKL